MRAILGFLCLISLVSSQAPPNCAIKCWDSFEEGGNGCDVIDFVCICSNSVLLSEYTCCVDTYCGSEDQSSAYNYAQSDCNYFNITVGLTCSSSSTASGTAIAMASTTATTTVVNTAASTSEAPSSSATSESTPTSALGFSQIPSASRSSTGTTSPSPASPTAGLTTGEKAAIGVATPICIMIIVAIPLWFILRRRKSSNAATSAPGHSYFKVGAPKEANPQTIELNASQEKVELDANAPHAIYELPAWQHRRGKITPTKQDVAELPANSPRLNMGQKIVGSAAGPDKSDLSSQSEKHSTVSHSDSSAVRESIEDLRARQSVVVRARERLERLEQLGALREEEQRIALEIANLEAIDKDGRP
ncbi:hypothetical protein BX600DRAFT_523005 [Xylariales sp. PMI_506]|nr:hypothetical protein BX600DRAFT_523005 [Xylariales sp. PMI_506]